jgi:glucose uptake protein
MVLIQNCGLAIAFCILVMVCWGSWANAQKIASKTWRFELFYWDMVLGIVVVGVLSAFTVGSLGSEGRTFFSSRSYHVQFLRYWIGVDYDFEHLIYNKISL